MSTRLGIRFLRTDRHAVLVVKGRGRVPADPHDRDAPNGYRAPHFALEGELRRGAGHFIAAAWRRLQIARGAGVSCQAHATRWVVVQTAARR